MYIKLSSSDLLLSWKLVKNPTSTFTKTINSYRKITGRFADERSYEAFIENDPRLFLENFWDLNMSNYLNPLNVCVSPFNLIMLTEVFRSALHGRADSSISEEEVIKSYLYQAVVGPFVEYNLSILRDVLDAAKLSYNFSDMDENGQPMRDHAQMLTIVGYDNLATFLKKVYVVCFASTASLDFLTTIGEDSKQDMIINFSGEWINNLTDKVFFVKKLSKFHKGIAEKFLTKLNVVSSKEFLDEGDELFKDNLHEQRHNAVANLLLEIAKTHTNEFSVLELGCGTGQFYRKLQNSDIKYVGIDANGIKVERAKDKNRSGTFLHGNIIRPLLHEKHLKSDAIVLTEVIEHLTASDRKELISLFKNFYLSQYIVVTTPNKEYNVNYGLSDEQMRHKDHEIEYTLETLYDEVINPLVEIGYSCLFYNFENEIISLEDAKKLPSFILGFFYVGESRSFNYKKFNAIAELFSGFYLPNTGQDVRTTTIMKGFNSRQVATKQDIFYLGATISPAEYDEKFPEFLEHPNSVFQYFADRGIHSTVVEKKYMGSRAYILAYRTAELAEVMGHKIITINSRSGFEFFDENKVYNFAGTQGTKDELELRIHQEIFKRCTDDFIMLDAEILPWLLKAEKLVEKDFFMPGHAELLFNRFTGKSTDNVEQYLNTLSMYTQQHDVEIRVFDLLAKGKISSRVNRWDKTVYNYTDILMGITQDKLELNETIEEMLADNLIVKSVEFTFGFMNTFVLDDWVKNCKEGAEGIVIKPAERLTFLDSGFPVQQAVKVRGEDYLRLVYGINYKDSEYFAQLKAHKVKVRNVQRKRQTAAVEAELSYNILRAFLNQNREALQRYIAAFIAIDNESSRVVDATL